VLSLKPKCWSAEYAASITHRATYALAQAGPPPAAKKAVASLPKEEVTEERLEELGGKDVECSVCR
jgi:hypothetical protein